MSLPAGAPEVTVIVPSFNGANRLPALLEALRRQTTDRAWELLVVLDGSADDSAVVLKRLGRDLPLRVVALDQNRGRPAALNVGFEESRGQVLIRCDDDLEPRWDYIERHASWHDGGRQVGVVGLPRTAFEPSRYAEVYGQRADEAFAAQAYAAPAQNRWVHWCGNCSVRRDVWAHVGDYNAEFVRGQDWEWGYRLKRTGVEIVIDPQLEVPHHYWGSCAQRRMARAFDTGEAEARFERLHQAPARPPSMGRPARAARAGRLKARAWAALVSLGGHSRNAGTYKRVGRWIDVALNVLPRALAYRLIAWGVESAATGGRRVGWTR